MSKYVVLCGQIVGGPSQPFETIYGFDGAQFDDRKKAIRHGFKHRGSDDFNIGVVENGRLVSLDWMDGPVDTSPELLAKISDQIYP